MRTMVLMDIANDEGGLVVGTGDLSELALGWATYNGDHMSMYGVNASVPKTLVKYLIRKRGGPTRAAKRVEVLAGYSEYGNQPGTYCRPKRENRAENGRARRPVRTARFLPVLCNTLGFSSAEKSIISQRRRLSGRYDARYIEEMA